MVYPYGGGWDTETGISRLDTLYAAGWDITSHSGRHEDFDAESAATAIKSFAECKAWLQTNEWDRGSDFSGYPYRDVLLSTLDGGDVLDPYLRMGRGRAARPIYGATGIKAYTSDETNPAIPFDLLSIADYDVATGTNARSDYVTPTDGLRVKLAETVLNKSVLFIFGHKFLADPGDDVTANSITWLDSFVADVAQYEAAGTLEVVTMTDWYNEIFGVNNYEIVGGNSNITTLKSGGKQ